MVESGNLPEGTKRFPVDFVRDFIVRAFQAVGISEEHAGVTAGVLLSADLRGVRSHGLGRLPMFIDTIERGVINKNSTYPFHAGSPTTGVLDADRGLGAVAANLSMEHAMAMAEKQGTGFVAVRNSSHLGYPGYWSKKAADRGFIGICMSNGGRFVTPTFGMEPHLGTNPLSVCIPAGPGEQPFHLDFATAMVARGKIETMLREEKPIPKGWVTEAYGPLKLDDRGILPFDIPMLPLGGEAPETGGHKGFALSLMVELLSSILSGHRAPESEIKSVKAGKPAFPASGHFLGAIRIEGFREPAEAFTHMAEIFARMRGAKKAPGHDRIFTPGEIEAEIEAENRRLGIPATPPMLAQMGRLNERLGLGVTL